MADEIKGGYKNSPCNHCDRKLTAACQKYVMCQAYREWLNACWADFRRFYRKYGGKHD